VRAKNHNGRARSCGAKAAPPAVKGSHIQRRHYRGSRGDTSRRDSEETWEALPRQLSLFEWEFQTEFYKVEPKGLHLNLCLRSREGRPIAERLATDN
jgi:hypothetical protein